MNFFFNYYSTAPNFFLMSMFIIVFSISAHEYAHAQVAYWEGDDTAARAGHLTLNPLVQMGFVSLICFLIFGIAWGAVPVNEAYLKHRYSRLKVDLAGIAMNLILALLFFCFMLGIIYYYVPEGRANFVEPGWFMMYVNHYLSGKGVLFPVLLELTKNFSPATTAALALCFLGAQLNLVLAFFNLLPIPMLDGWNVYAFFFPKLKSANSEVAKGIMMFFVLVLITFASYLFNFSEFLVLKGIGIFFG